MLSNLIQDLLFGLRLLRKTPVLTLAVVITLGLGIGANTAIFSVVNFFLFRPLPVNNPDQMVVLGFTQRHGHLQSQFSYPDFSEIRSESKNVFSHLIGYKIGLDGLSVNGKADRILTCYVTGDYFEALGIQPELGRFIIPSEDSSSAAEPVIVLGYSLWKTRFDSDPKVVGSKVSVDGHPFTIVGVAPKNFHGLHPLLSTDAYLPLGMAIIEGQSVDFRTDRRAATLTVLARLKENMSLRQAQASLDVIADHQSSLGPDSARDFQVRVFPERLTRPEPSSSASIHFVSGIFLALTALVLTLACVNVTGIFLVRATMRRHEMAVRASLGATRWRLIRQLLSETFLLALFGGIAGTLIAYGCCRLISSINLRTDIPFEFNFDLDWRVLSFTAAVVLLTGVLVGVAPAFRASPGNLSVDLHSGGQSGTRSQNRVRSILVVGQVAGSLTLLITAGLLARSLERAQRMNLGFDAHHVVNMTMDLNEIGYSEPRTREFYKLLLERVRNLPGVETASLAFSVPMGYNQNSGSVAISGNAEASAERPTEVGYNCISPGYLKTLHIDLRSGRDFSVADDESTQHVALVNEAMASRFWPGEDPIGHSFRLSGDPESTVVVGVVGDSRQASLPGPMRPYFFVPLAQNYSSLETLQVRSMILPQTMIREIRMAIQNLEPNLPVFDVQTMEQALGTLDGLLVFRFGAVLAAALGFLGMVLAVVGVYGVVSYAATRNNREIGIRLALGATPLDIFKMICARGLIIASAGIAVGFILALSIARLLASMLIGVAATDPLTYSSAAALLLLVILPACYVPARRAMGTDVMSSIRHE
ncbi:MAG TPA: ABC transporter permease [Candidatus Acidoferrales bacterium]|nr:ABC transporter permease [Candidatus Acidoferrales bacterium]